jgi:very-short-patch-repair endonuclease
LRQRPILGFIADFFCKKLKLVLEVDGLSHFYKVEKDLQRDEKLNSHGYKVLRVFEEEVRNDIDNVIREIENVIQKIEKE